MFHAAMEEKRVACARCSENWMRYTSAELDSGCIFISGAVEFDDRPGLVRDAHRSRHRLLQRAIAQARRRPPGGRRG